MSAGGTAPAGRLSRRALLKLAGLTGGGLVVGLSLSQCASTPPPPAVAKRGGFSADALVQITPEGEVHFVLPRAEMGQGVYEGLTVLVAEELEVTPESIRVHHAPLHEAYNLPGSIVQITGGSTSINRHYEPLRQVGANMREAIRLAAAEDLATAPDTLELADGIVILGDRRWSYGRFVETAARRPLPSNTPLKSPDRFRLIGRDRPRLDAWDKVTGAAEFGLDVDFPGLHRAVLRRCPVAGGRVAALDDSAARAMPGVRKVVTIFNGVAVVADSLWQARQAADRLEIEWDLPELARISSPALRARMEQALAEDGLEAHARGDGAAALERSARRHAATYWAPYLAHATMEPINCTVRLDGGTCEVWVGSQAPVGAVGAAARHAGLPRASVTLHPTFLGGGFGRRVTSENVAEATAIAKASGLAVQLVWSREDDMRHDRYRPASLVRLEAGLSEQGALETWSAKRVGPNVAAHFGDDLMEYALPEFLPFPLADWASRQGHWFFRNVMVNGASVHGLFGDYDAPHQEVRHVTVDSGLPIGYWRSVGHSCNAFFAESFVDELAHEAGRDPVEFRLAHNRHDPRMQRVIRLAAEKAGWGRPAPGRFLGIAAHNSFETAVAQVMEISLEGDAVRLHRVTCALDCGRVITPDIVRAQMESGILYGLAAALYGEITLKDGAVEQGNFDDYPMLRMDVAPAIEVHIAPSEAPPTGVGEPGLPPAGPALGNAIFAATGRRLRELPLAHHIEIV